MYALRQVDEAGGAPELSSLEKRLAAAVAGNDAYKVLGITADATELHVQKA